MDHYHAASQGRLEYEGEEWRSSSWSTLTNDKSQWLQIDLRSIYIKVTRVATQGRTGWHMIWQWVTHYMLQFSDDGENFTFFKELGKSAAKVAYMFCYGRVSGMFCYNDRYLDEQIAVLSI